MSRHPPYTARQREVLAYIARYRALHGYAPTCRELCAHFRWASLNSAACHLKALRRKGALEWSRTQARTVTLTSAGALVAQGVA